MGKKNKMYLSTMHGIEKNIRGLDITMQYSWRRCFMQIFQSQSDPHHLAELVSFVFQMFSVSDSRTIFRREGCDRDSRNFTTSPLSNQGLTRAC